VCEWGLERRHYFFQVISGVQGLFLSLFLCGCWVVGLFFCWIGGRRVTLYYEAWIPVEIVKHC